MLNSSEHEILKAHKYKNISRNSAFLGSDKPRMLFFPLINVSRKYIAGFDLLVKNKRFCAVYANIPIPRSQTQYKFKYNNLPVENSPL